VPRAGLVRSAPGRVVREDSGSDSEAPKGPGRLSSAHPGAGRRAARRRAGAASAGSPGF
jgi:hypothetical protein